MHVPYSFFALISVTIFALVHLFAEKTRRLNTTLHGRFLSMGGGVAIAFVFVDLLPKLARSDSIVRELLYGLFPYFERHVYVMALLGFLLFFTVDRSKSFLRGKGRFWLSLGSYTLFNFLVGYAVVDKNDPEVRPLALFTFAIALHYFSNDFSLTESHGKEYQRFGKWVLIGSLYLGWLAGLCITLSATAVALVSAFIAGGVIMNVTRHELPNNHHNSLGAFLAAAVFYMCVLLAIG
ncbi:MAG: hypothetical protein JWO53_26 [Chlamydiia bacterium]|nr:hypothetical protein [Chlamydiia bacterium]